MRPAPAWIAWAALAGAVTGCCRMQPPSAVDSLESTWARLRESSADKPAPPPAEAPAADEGPPAGPPPEPASAEGAPSRPRPIPLTIPPASGEAPFVSPDTLPLTTGSSPGGRVPEGAAASLRVGDSPSAPRTGAAAPLPIPASPNPAAPASLGAGLGDAASAAGVPGSRAASASLPAPDGWDAEPGSLLRRESFLPSSDRPGVPAAPVASSLAVGAGGGAGVPVSAPAVPLPASTRPGGEAAGGRLPPVPSPAAVGVERSPASPPTVGKPPGLLAAEQPATPSDPLPSRALERAAAENPDRDAARRARDEAAWREREAEAGVLRQFLRRVLRLDPPAAAESAPSAGPVSEPPR